MGQDPEGKVVFWDLRHCQCDELKSGGAYSVGRRLDDGARGRRQVPGGRAAATERRACVMNALFYT